MKRYFSNGKEQALRQFCEQHAVDWPAGFTHGGDRKSMTTIRINSDALGIDARKDLRWSTHRDLDKYRSKSVEATTEIDLPGTRKAILTFVKGGPLSESGKNVTLIDCRDEEGAFLADIFKALSFKIVQ